MIPGAVHPGIAAAVGAALLFGLATPVAKILLGEMNLFLLAGLLYLGAGVGLSLMRRLNRAPAVSLAPSEKPWLIGAILSGGIVAPALMMLGLSGMAASEASLLLSAEGVFTALLAWLLFRENITLRIALGLAAITAGAVLISGGQGIGLSIPTLLLLAACLAWALDNNLTRHVSLADGTWIAAVKGLAAGTVNIVIAFSLGAELPPAAGVLWAMVLGFLAYGVSLTLFIRSLRDLGTARTGACFALAPFFGSAIAVSLGDPVTIALITAGVLMAAGVWLHVTEIHAHEHHHDEADHAHWHTHDLHHSHAHAIPVAAGTRHTHRHHHAALTHSHAHFPDAHHRHRHS